MHDIISIIVPIFNRERVLRSSVDSVLNQTYPHFELILVDDGSTDDSPSICHHYAERDPRVVVVEQTNSGVSAARNSGLLRATGRYVSFLDSDDILERGFLESMLARLQSDGSQAAALVEMSVRPPPADIGCPLGVVSGADAVAWLLELRFPSSVWAYLYEREYLERVQFSPSIHFFEDVLFNVQALHALDRVSLVREMLYRYLPDASSANASKLTERRLSCLEVYPTVRDLWFYDLDVDVHAQVLRAHCLVSVVAALANGAIPEGREHFGRIKTEARSMLKDVLNSPRAPISSKIVVLATSLSPLVAGLLLRCRRCCSGRMPDMLRGRVRAALER